MPQSAIHLTSQVCSRYGIRYVVISPGSRNAPLMLSFANNKNIRSWVIPDERSAGFVALGIAQASRCPVALICTSGTAMLNYAPAVAEAYYREIPLLIMSADRPPELIDQRDGQTIRQFEALKNHVKASYKMPLLIDKTSADTYFDILQKALHTLLDLPKGPVHINVPLKEPLYSKKLAKFHFDVAIYPPTHLTIEEDIVPDISSYKKVLILIGQMSPDEKLNKTLRSFKHLIPIIGTLASNISECNVQHVDAFVKDQATLKPDLLITTGYSVLSKKLKQFLRGNKPQMHLHFDPANVYVDTYSSNPHIIKQSLEDFLKKTTFEHLDTGYLKEWKRETECTKTILRTWRKKAPFCESSAFFEIFGSIPKEATLHLSNSMPVRFADLFGVSVIGGIFANRGTSGIDGCTSTAVGHAFVQNNLNILVTGDMAFHYDKNAFFHEHPLPNLRVIILNNFGGGIFRLLDGPSTLPELETYFVAGHSRTANYICKENNFLYRQVTSYGELNDAMLDFYQPADRTKVLEVITELTLNQESYTQLNKMLS